MDEIEKEIWEGNGPKEAYCTRCGACLFKEDRPGICSTCKRELKCIQMNPKVEETCFGTFYVEYLFTE